MVALVTLSEALLRLRLTETESFHVPDVEMKIEQATAIVVNYLKRADDYAWELVDPTEMSLVKAAILEVVRNMFEGLDPLPEAVKNLLWRYRDPALA